DLIGKNDYDMPWAGPEADFYRATDRRIMETRQTEVDIVEPQTRPDGSNAWLTTSKVPLTSVDGQVIGILGTYMDITERVRNEEQLKWANRLGEAVRSVQARFIAADNPRMAFEAILDDIIALTESEFGFIAEVLNDENGSPYQRTYAISNIAWNDETRAHYAEFRDVGLEFRNPNTLLGQVVTTAEAVVANAPASDPRRGGMPFGHPEINAFLGLPLRIGPELVGTIGLANRSGGYSEDLPSQLEPLTTAMARMIRSWQSDTARREAESELQEKKAELEYLFDSSLDLIIVGSADGRARRINQAWTATLGYQPADLVDTPMLDLVHPEDRAEAASRLEMVTGRATVIEAFPIRLRHKDGSYRWVEWRGVPAAEGAFFGTGRDVTDRKRDEAELVAARQRAEAATHAKSMFLATMSHEIRTPMNGVLGMTSLLRDTALTTEQQDYVDTIHRSGESLLAIINDILDFSKIEAGRVELDIAPFETGTLGHDVRSLLGAAAAAKGLELRIEIDEAVPQWARADGGRIRQVLLNLTGNAIKFTTRGAVTVRLVIASSDRGPLLRCEVRDTGIGMTRDAIDRLFVPFTQGDPGMSRRFGGTGLGLAISKRLVELMGGSIGAASVPGEGSTFWFTALITPVAEPAYRPAGARAAEPIAPLPDLRVLLAEDNVVNQKVAGKILQKLGCRVEIAANGREAIEMHRREPYDLILMDWQMPELDGVEATRAIRADPTLRQVPIIAMTANAMRGDREECLRAGMDDYLAKPIDAGRLRETLARWARRPTIGGTQGISARSCFLTRNKPS
ncbi:MAG: response regulator, partial [Gemmatimonadales bacterium]